VTVNGVPRRCREPAVAGTFYPAQPRRLASTVDRLLGEASETAAAIPPRALVVPHAGYRYSGPVAAAAYRVVRGLTCRCVVLLGPAHFVAVTGAAVPGLDGWRTPLGVVPVDGESRHAALAVADVHVDDLPHAREHSLEVQLPFLQRAVDPPPPVLPIVVDAPPGTVADLLDVVVSDPAALVVASTDLSHYLSDESARRRDARTAAAVLALDADGIGDGDACGAHALRGVLEWGRRHGLRAQQLALATSADRGGDRGRVVGYGAFAFWASAPGG
jgi:MEMO1 family protein